MRFTNLFVFREQRFSIGIEQPSGRFYLSIPVANRLVDYEEYYEVPRELAEEAPDHLAELEQLADRCRRRQNDEHLIIQPGGDRGSAI